MTVDVSSKEFKENIKWQVGRNDRKIEEFTRRGQIWLGVAAACSVLLLNFIRGWQPSLLEQRLSLSYFLAVGAVIFPVFALISVSLILKYPKVGTIGLEWIRSIRLGNIPLGVFLVASAIILVFVSPPLTSLTLIAAIEFSLIFYVFIGIGFLSLGRLVRKMTDEEEKKMKDLRLKKPLLIALIAWFFFGAVWMLTATRLIAHWSTFVEVSTIDVFQMILFVYPIPFSISASLLASSWKFGYRQLNEEYQVLITGYDEGSQLSDEKMVERHEDLTEMQRFLDRPGRSRSFRKSKDDSPEE